MGAAGVTAGAAVVGAGASAASALGSKGGAQSSGSSSTAPWVGQQPYLLNGFANAQNVYNQQAAAGAYPGERYAPTNNTQNTASTIAGNYANGSSLPGQFSNAATAGLGAQGSYLSNAQDLSQGGLYGPNTGTMSSLNNYAQGGGLNGVQKVNGGLSSALNQAGTNGANAINNFNTGLSSAAASAAQDPTQRLAADAGTYMNASPVQQSVNSTNAMIDQTLNEQTLPGLNRQAAQGGALNSSRAGAANAMAQEGASLAKGNADASLYNNAYNTGLQTANSTYGTGLGAQVAANTNGLNANTNLSQGQQNYQLNQQQAETGTQLSAGEAALASQLGYNNLDSSTRLGANAQLGAGVNQGLTAGLDSGTAATGNFALGSAAGAVPQTNQQNIDNAALLQWQQENGGAALAANQNYLSQVNGSYGTQTNTTQQNPYSPVASGLGTAATLAGLYKNNAGAFDSLGTSLGNYFSGAASSANDQIANPYGATGSGQMIVGSNGLAGGGV